MASLKGKVLLASRGAIVSIGDIQESQLSATQGLLEGNGHLFTVVDVRKPADVQAWIDKTISQLGRLDDAANLAGVTTDGVPITEETDENWDFLMDVNAQGVFNCMTAQSRVISGGGPVVNAASVAGKVGGPCWSIYAASKHAFIGLTKSAAREVGAKSIRKNCIAPGTIDTPMTQGMEQRLGMKVPTSAQALDRRARPEEAANVISFLLGDEATFVTGATYNVDGGHLC